MTDIVERLHQVRGDNEDAREAAREIELLREEVKRLKAEVADRDRIMNMSD